MMFKLHLLVFTVFDKIHRCIRDIKLATEHSLNMDMARAVLWWQHLTSLNGKPFGSGEWFF